MQAKLIGMAITQLLKVLTPELFKEFIDTILDKVEESVLGSASKIDDLTVIPICNMIRRILDVPDND